MQRLRRWTPFVLLLSLCFPTLGQDPTFKTQSRLVVVPVTVAEKKGGERIWDLQQNDFTLLDNGQERKIVVEPWGTYESRASLVVVVETSLLAQAAILKIRKIASSLDNITGESGEVAVVTADSHVRTLLDFTKAWEPLQETFENLAASGEKPGRVLDAIDTAVAMLSNKPQGQRRLILLFCEGHDRGSFSKSLDVLTHAEQQNVVIYTASFSAFLTPFTTKGTELDHNPEGRADYYLGPVFKELDLAMSENIGKTLAEYTGGRELGFVTQRRLESDLEELGKEIHSQYQISFAPPSDQKPVYHEISIKVKNHWDAIIRARPGYWIGATPVEQLDKSK